MVGTVAGVQEPLLAMTLRQQHARGDERMNVEPAGQVHVGGGDADDGVPARDKMAAATGEAAPICGVWNGAASGAGARGVATGNVSRGMKVSRVGGAGGGWGVCTGGCVGVL